MQGRSIVFERGGRGGGRLIPKKVKKNFPNIIEILIREEER